MLIEEYEQTLTERAKDRQKAEEKMRFANDRNKHAIDKLDQDMLLGNTWYLLYNLSSSIIWLFTCHTLESFGKLGYIIFR